MTAEDKEKIDYEIKAKQEARDKEVSSYGCLVLIIVVFFMFAIKGC